VWRGSGNIVPPKADIDHLIDLQLGGMDDISNMGPLNYSVNRSLGPQIANQLKGIPIGTCVYGVGIR
jgi:hypothetical protein